MLFFIISSPDIVIIVLASPSATRFCSENLVFSLTSLCLVSYANWNHEAGELSSVCVYSSCEIFSMYRDAILFLCRDWAMGMFCIPCHSGGAQWWGTGGVFRSGNSHYDFHTCVWNPPIEKRPRSVAHLTPLQSPYCPS